MPAPSRTPGKTAFALTFAVALTVCLTQGAMAQTSSASLYGLNQKGKLTVNATVLDSLKGSKWVDMVVSGSDRWALRDDGRVDMNGVQQYKIKCKDNNNNNVDEGLWVGLEMRDGEIWALSANGYMAKEGVCAAQLPQDDFVFTSLFSGTTDGTENTWALRSDGAVFVNTITGAIFDFDGGPGLDPDAAEGDSSDTEWRSGAVKPDDGVILAMRRDGIVVVGTFQGGDGTPYSGTQVASLPFNSAANNSTLYADIAFTEDNMWNALRGNGQVYNQDFTLNPVIEFNSSSNDTFVDMLPLPASAMEGDDTTTDMSYFALRRDGKLYRETDKAAVASLPNSGYGMLALSSEAPDLTNNKNALPKVSVYNIQAVTGTPYSFPILATDTDKAQDDLVVTVDPETLPDGAVYDSMTRTVSCDSPVKGKGKIKVTVDDGVGKPVNKTFKVTVRDPPKNPDKNAKPRGSKIKGTQALVGIPLSLPILASDQNGDDITISVDETQPPFTLGATFDPMTNVFSWDDSNLADIGKYTVKFSITDGTANSNLKVKINLVSSLLGF